MGKYIKHRCPECRGYNVTPIGKRQIGKDSICSYICESCHKQFGPVTYYKG